QDPDDRVGRVAGAHHRAPEAGRDADHQGNGSDRAREERLEPPPGTPRLPPRPDPRRIIQLRIARRFHRAPGAAGIRIGRRAADRRVVSASASALRRYCAHEISRRSGTRTLYCSSSIVNVTMAVGTFWSLTSSELTILYRVKARP